MEDGLTGGQLVAESPGGSVWEEFTSEVTSV